MKLIKRFLTLPLFFAVATVQAEDLMSVYQLALQNDPQLQVAREQLNAARETKSLARSQLLPTLSLIHI